MPQDITGTENFTGGAYQKPVAKDTGDVVATTLDDLFDRITNHNHTGQDSKAITLNITKEVQDLVATVDFNWIDQGNDVHRAQIALPAVATVDDNMRNFFYVNGGEYVRFYPTVEKIDNTNMYVYSNDNTIDMRIVYL